MIVVILNKGVELDPAGETDEVNSIDGATHMSDIHWDPLWLLVWLQRGSYGESIEG